MRLVRSRFTVPVFALSLAAVVVDLAVLFAVGHAIGVLPTILLLVLGAVLGVALIRREGRRTFAAFRDAVLTGRMPHQEMADGVLIAAAGALVALPGLISDVAALTLLFPPSRAVVRKRMLRRAGRMRDRTGPVVVDSTVVVDAREPEDERPAPHRAGGPIVLPPPDHDRGGNDGGGKDAG
jgi:UPF0716 protein FxsA